MKNAWKQNKCEKDTKYNKLILKIKHEIIKLLAIVVIFNNCLVRVHRMVTNENLPN